MSRKIKQKINKEKGQVVLVVLLASALILTLGLSASKITTVETKIDTDQELLKKAFNVAESGIENYLATGKTDYLSNSDNAQANLEVNNLGNVSTLSFNSMTLTGHYDFFWLVNHNTDGSIGSNYYSTNTSTIDICVDGGGAKRLKVDYFYMTGGDYGVQRQVFQIDSDGDGDDNCAKGFDLSGGGKNSLLLTVYPVDGAAKLKITGANNFPVQGEEISATGKVEGVNNTITVLDKYETFGLAEAVVAGGNVTSTK